MKNSLLVKPQESGSTVVELNGRDISTSISGFELSMEVNSYPELKLNVVAQPELERIEDVKVVINSVSGELAELKKIRSLLNKEIYKLDPDDKKHLTVEFSVLDLDIIKQLVHALAEHANQLPSELIDVINKLSKKQSIG